MYLFSFSFSLTKYSKWWCKNTFSSVMLVIRIHSCKSVRWLGIMNRIYRFQFTDLNVYFTWRILVPLNFNCKHFVHCSNYYILHAKQHTPENYALVKMYIQNYIIYRNGYIRFVVPCRHTMSLNVSIGATSIMQYNTANTVYWDISFLMKNIKE